MTSTGSARQGYRIDINGLRAVAIVPVVLFHSGVTLIPGGFIGVDLFYVISGYLITGLLLREAAERGRVRLADFWARRMRRLVPALCVVITATLVASVYVSSPLKWETLAIQGGASLVFVSNLVFAQTGTDYFADELIQSPFLHTWSLAVEEQFYLVWPLAIVAMCVLARRLPYSLLAVARVVFGVTAAGSLVLSVLLTRADPTWAFYLLPTRAWEFALGGLLATVSLERLTSRRGVSTGMGVAGLALIGWSLLAIEQTDPFPGWVATVPVLGGLLIIAAGMNAASAREGLAARVLGTPPMQYLGSVSYSWYLWHWPVIIYLPLALGSDALWLKLLAGALSLGLAAASYPLIENRIRFDRRLTASARRTFVFTAAIGAAVAVVAVALFGAGRYMLDQEPYGYYARVLDDTPDQTCSRTVEPTPGVVACEYGDEDADRTVLVIGDSHAGQWQEALAAAADQAGIRLLVRWEQACPATPVEVVAVTGQHFQGCPEFQAGNVRLADALQPDAVVISQAATYGGRILDDSGTLLPDGDQLGEWEASYRELLTELKPTSAHVAVIMDNPRLDFDPLECLARLTADPADCVEPRSDALAPNAELDAVTRGVLSDQGVDDLFSVTDDVCDEDTCHTLDGSGVPIYRDYNHLSIAWTLLQVDPLERFLTTITTPDDAEGSATS